MIVEVLSDGTRRTEQGEKRDNYLVIESVQIYVLMEQTEVKAVVYERNSSGEFVAAVYQGAGAKIPLAAIKAEVDLGEIYRGIVSFT